MASVGTLVAYAAAPGQTAEGRYADRNSLFTKYLLQHLNERAEINQVLTRVRSGVVRENPRQLPETRSLLTQPLFLAAAAEAPPAPLTSPLSGDADIIAWQSVERCGIAACYQAYLADHPQGKFANLARAQVERLTLSSSTPPAPPPAVAAAPAAPTVGQVFHDKLKDGSDGPAMVMIPAGRFQMGSPANERDRQENERQHEVRVAGFAIGQYEVTFEEYDRFCVATGRDKPDDTGWGRGKRPVIVVRWNDAMAYADWLSTQTGRAYRLPTEAEWEYACRGGAEEERYCGGNNVDQLAWYSGNSGNQTHPVGQKVANDFGLHDLSGNVWEWTCSAYHNYGGAETECADKDTSDPLLVRGGSWSNEPVWVRSASRFWSDPTSRTKLLGFRLARSF